MAALWLAASAYLAAVLLPVLLGLMVVSPDLVPVVFGAPLGGLGRRPADPQHRRDHPRAAVLGLRVPGRDRPARGDDVDPARLTLPDAVRGRDRRPAGASRAIAVCFVICQLIAVEIPMFIIVLSRDGGCSPRTVAARRLGRLRAPSLVMAGACLVGRQALESLGVGMAGARGADDRARNRRLRARAVVCSRRRSAGALLRSLPRAAPEAARRAPPAVRPAGVTAGAARQPARDLGRPRGPQRPGAGRALHRIGAEPRTSPISSW